MSTELIRQVEKLAKKVNFKYVGLTERLNQLEQNQAASTQAVGVVALISAVVSATEYTPTPKHFTPIYVVPTESITP